MPPLIGISTSEMRAPERTRALAKGEPPTRELALGLSYPRSIEVAGAVPVVIPPLELDRIDALLARLGGLVISGGPDIHPAAYGEYPDPALGPTEPELDAFEIAMVRRADALGLPILGICRGMQVVNVARGGTLVQDIAEHRQKESGRVPTHKVVVKEGSNLERMMGPTRPPGEHAVNSFHHQAINRLGRALTPVAWSLDGVIEGVEASDRDFLVGVQWHAESLSTQPDQEGIYEAFLRAAAAFEAAAGRAAAA
jgi:putative glutamine amidotransferase